MSGPVVPAFVSEQCDVLRFRPNHPLRTTEKTSNQRIIANYTRYSTRQKALILPPYVAITFFYLSKAVSTLTDRNRTPLSQTSFIGKEFIRQTTLPVLDHSSLVFVVRSGDFSLWENWKNELPIDTKEHLGASWPLHYGSRLCSVGWQTEAVYEGRFPRYRHKH